MTSSMPTLAATARAARSLSPVSSTGRRPSSRSWATASAEVALTVSAHDQHGRVADRPSRRARACGRRLGGLLGGAQVGGRLQRPVGEEPFAGRRPRRGRRRRPDAEPLRVGERLDRRPARRRGRGRRRRWPGRSGARWRPRASPARRSASSTVVSSVVHDVDEGHPAGRDGAGLVEHDRVDLAGRLEHLGALDQDPELGAAAGADHQRGRRRQPEGARAGDDQHRDGGGERDGRAVGGGGGQPEPERGDGERDHDRHEDRRHPVGEALDGRLAGLGVLDEPGDLRQRGVGADPGRLHDEPSAGVDRRAA